MGRTSKNGAGGSRGAVQAEEGNFRALFNAIMGRPAGGSASSAGSNAGYVYPSSSPPYNLQRLQEAGFERATQLLSDNPELKNTASVMLPNGAVVQRPNPDISREEARLRVSDDILRGRRVDPYESGLATGAVLTRDEQAVAQRALRNIVSQGFITNGTFDVIPPVSSDVLRRAAGVSGDVSAEVRLKAKSFQSGNMPNQQRDRQGDSGNRSGGGGGERFIRTQAAKDWMARRYDPSVAANSDARGAINRAVQTARDKNDLIRLLSADPRTRMSNADASHYVGLLDENRAS